jgi:excisionase family DNA binding protein
MQLLTVAEAADKLSVHEDTVRRLIGRGELRAVRVGRALRIEEETLVAYVRGQRPPLATPTSKITSGQLRALHAKSDALDRALEQPRSSSKRAVLRAAGEHFNRSFESANDLDEKQATWALDQLEAELERTL